MEQEASPIPSVTFEKYTKIMKLLGDTQKPEINMVGKFNFKPIWIIDSKATDHVSCHESYISKLKRIDSGMIVSIPNCVPVIGFSSTQLRNNMKIVDVFLIPKFMCNILLVSNITNDLNCSMTSFPKFCSIQDLHSRKMIGTGRCEDGLYKM